MKKVVMVIAQDGFQDEELRQPRKILEDAGIEVKIASSTLDLAKGTFGSTVLPDILINNISLSDFAGIIFIGGAGAAQYWDDPVSHELIKQALARDKIVGAICIAPVTLARAGVLNGKRATVWSTESGQIKAVGANYTGRPVEKDGNIITASGPQAAREFGEELLKALNY